MEKKLIEAFRFHMRNQRPAFYHAQGYKGPNAWPERAYGIAVEALKRARADIEAGKARYPREVRVTWQQEDTGLRLVGRVEADCGGRNGYFSDDGGWLTDPHGDVFRDGSGLCYGLVYQLPARNGCARFLAGYEFGGVDGGPTLNKARIFEGTASDNCSYDCAKGNDAARDAARYADSMAQKAAEKEREYQTAWQAGSLYASEAETVSVERSECLAILKERRALKGTTGYPAICGAITSTIREHISTIQKAREDMRKLAKGDYKELYFWPGDSGLQSAFCEGAGIDKFPNK